MLPNSIFSFSRDIFPSLTDSSEHVCYIKFVVCNSLPNNKFLDLSQLKAFADDKLTVAEKFQLVFGRVENIVEKGEKASRVVKCRDCVVKS